jgi:hypothetical protein
MIVKTMDFSPITFSPWFSPRVGALASDSMDFQPIVVELLNIGLPGDIYV